MPGECEELISSELTFIERFLLISLLGVVIMPLFVVGIAVFNMALGFVLAVYLGAAPRFTNSRVPFLREGRKEPSPLVRRLLAFLPKRKAAPLP